MMLNKPTPIKTLIQNISPYRINAYKEDKPQITAIKYSVFDNIRIFFSKMYYRLFPSKSSYENYIVSCLKGKIGKDE